MGGADGIDIVPLHQQNVVEHILLPHRTAGIAAELVAVHTPEHDALSVDFHEAVFNFKTAEADFAALRLQQPAFLILQANDQGIQMRCFGTPKQRIVHCLCGRQHQCFPFPGKIPLQADGLDRYGAA
ncbi:hypothetical protein D3C75_911950 [compost metagenome]